MRKAPNLPRLLSHDFQQHWHSMEPSSIFQRYLDVILAHFRLISERNLPAFAFLPPSYLLYRRRRKQVIDQEAT